MLWEYVINPIQYGGGGWDKKPPSHTSFFLVTSTNVGFGPQNFLTFNFNPFATLVQKTNQLLSSCLNRGYFINQEISDL